MDSPEPPRSRGAAPTVNDEVPVVGDRPRSPVAASRTSTSGFLAWWRERALVILTGALVILTAWLIVATYNLERIANREESIIHTEAMDSPPQVELVARVLPPSYSNSIGEFDFQNRGSSYLSAAYAWCWGDDASAFNVKRRNMLQPAAQLRSITIHGDASLDFGLCSGAISQWSTPHKPRYLYSYVAYETPSGNCKNRQQWFLLSPDGKSYDNSDDPGIFPSSLNTVARTAAAKAIENGPRSDWNLANCLGPASTL
ncbi:MAG: hypothetical protein ACLPWG_22740 [Steroidobacteraceae bacterium]